jgi:hypothetical protein
VLITQSIIRHLLVVSHARRSCVSQTPYNQLSRTLEYCMPKREGLVTKLRTSADLLTAASSSGVFRS